MYWLLDDETKETVRTTIAGLVTSLATVTGNSQNDQLFPFIGRKDIRKASVVIKELSGDADWVIDPFSGSGIFSYAASALGRQVQSNEWEPYAHRMSSAPWRLPDRGQLDSARQTLSEALTPKFNFLYHTTCDCGNEHVIDSQFFDRVPLRYAGVEQHERLGANGETVAYRQSYRCPNCGATNKFFTPDDQRHLDAVNATPLAPRYKRLFATQLIRNSRINLSDDWTTYGNLFPHRSKLALGEIWDAIEALDVTEDVRLFAQDAFLAIIPQAKFKDYRSKSQDLHVPEVKLREVNLLTRFIDSFDKRASRLGAYSFAGSSTVPPIDCSDFRDFLSKLAPGFAQLVLTDPPWTDGNAYFEKAQLYHPWLGYRLIDDADRLANEFVVTDAPSRSEEHDETRWWVDMAEFFDAAATATKDLGYLAMYFRPIPARRWLENLNRLKLQARMAGFEPLLSVDVSSDDPSMRIQQSASFVFSSDIVFVFLKLPKSLRRHFAGDIDLDHLAFKTADELQQRNGTPFSERSWRREFSRRVVEEGVPHINLPESDYIVSQLFTRYTREVHLGLHLVRSQTPFDGHLFDVPAAERLFAYVPAVVRELTATDTLFTYDMFLLRLAAYVENGTRMLIKDVQGVDMRKILSPYAIPVGEGKRFMKRPVPTLPTGISEIMELDPYQFEHFAAELLRRQGFTDVAVQGGSGDRGVDIAAIDSNGVGVVAQCKRYIGNVSATPIQRLHSFSLTRGAGRRIVITTSGYTRDALDEASRTDTELIDGPRLEALVAELMPEFGKSDPG